MKYGIFCVCVWCGVCVWEGGWGDSSYNKQTFILLTQLLKLQLWQGGEVQVKVCLADWRLHLYKSA